ncbi:hypothetical protein CAPTEDRAFT_179942 [Capitella teleta]|uniref:BRISC and BRCA1-A complex member 1 n=1 Tax=Capitella teleta TaxID=283909 RepID=R7TPK5_CAPTE|nr:hypothetical protein CAPTEDRAFT_179942 [Capitella teleta]|eukprot:ELT95502.1 hypothetical protein CAPTEDRAFT_179942 [Capitella teleta]
MNSKHLIDARHEFALVYLQDAAFWMSDFTSEPSKIVTILEDMSSCVPTSSFDMSSIFEVIQQNVRLPSVRSNPHVIPPPYIVRTILLYGRSHCIPTFSTTKAQLELTSSPYFFMDAYYLHQVPSDENKCEAIFDVLCSLDRTGLSYVNEVSRNPTKLYDCMAQFLPHPLQRPIQRHACYDIEDQATPLTSCTSGPPAVPTS